MKPKWNQQDRAVMQVIIDDYKEILRTPDLDDFFIKRDNRDCGFCELASKIALYSTGTTLNKCRDCRIYKVFGKKCFTAFPIWNLFEYESKADNGLGQFKIILTAAIEELKEWGLE